MFFKEKMYLNLEEFSWLTCVKVVIQKFGSCRIYILSLVNCFCSFLIQLEKITSILYQYQQM